VNEQTRLQHELEMLDQRRDRIQQRLEVLRVQVAALEKSAHQLRDSEIQDGEAPKSQPVAQPKNTNQDGFNTFFLEY